MSKPRTQHTVESLKARTQEVGDCWEWRGYYQNGVPQVVAWPDGKKKMVSVRRLLRELSMGKRQPDGHYGNTCANPYCVNPDHTLWRGEAAHMRHMAKKRTVTPDVAIRMRNGRIAAGQTKIDQAQADEIRVSTESGPVLAERYGISRSMVNKIKRGTVWRLLTSPFAGLFR